MCKPEFTEPLTDLQVVDGETLSLQCTVNGDPEPQITWSKNGKAISSSEIMNLKYKNGVATLTINEVYPEDEGLYTCTATNSIGATETKCNLTIKCKCYFRGAFRYPFHRLNYSFYPVLSMQL